MFALSPPPIDRCRVLELGCASGGNLIPLAFAFPRSEFVGLDYSRHQVDDAQATIGALGVDNIRIECASILDVTHDWGKFDYILCHGVFSWVDADVQDKILAIARDNLADDGVAYVSYNTYPGWHLRDMVRHMMRYHASQFAEPDEQVQQARALLAFLASASRQSDAYGQMLRGEAVRLGGAPDAYLYHEHLERTNTPLYFHEFIARAARFDLQYLSEAVVSDMLTTHLGPEVSETLERISPDILHLEQYLDFVRNRQFRQTLLCHDAAHPKRALTPAFLRGLLLSSAATVDSKSVDLSEGVQVTFTAESKRATVAAAATKAAFTVLIEQWPRAIDFDALCSAALERAAPALPARSIDDARQRLVDDLFGAVMYGMIQPHTCPLRCTNTVSNRPRAHPVAALLARSSPVVVNAHHAAIQLDATCLQALQAADGTRTRAEIADLLDEPSRIDGVLATLTRSALLIE